ncbi:MAG: antibiotic biosynthesis monooxygenase [Actinobacteria bacterium]|nr:antibiotic biosynthesis monooxygenase [Actinomycetota bacterium]
MVILINRFTLTASPQAFEEAFEESAVFMRAQPGFVRHTLVKSLRDPQTYVNIAQWQDADDHIRVVHSPEFKEHVTNLAKVSRADPDLYSVVQEVPDPAR